MLYSSGLLLPSASFERCFESILYTADGSEHCNLAAAVCGSGPLLNGRLHRVRFAPLFPFTSKGAVMRKTLLALSVLAGLAGGTAAIPADAAPLAHGLLPSVEVPLLVVGAATGAVLNEGASVQTVQYSRRYGRHAFYGRHSYYGRHAFYNRHPFYGRRSYDRY